MKNHAAMICKRILSNASLKSSVFAAASLHYDPFFISSFNFDNASLQIRQFSGKPRFDFGCIREPDDVVALFREMLRIQPRPSIVDFTKLLSVVVKIKQYSIALHLFDKMLQRKTPVNEYTLSIVINCFCRLNRADFGFSILGSFFKRGFKPNVVIFTSLINGLFSIGKIYEAAKLLEYSWYSY